MGEGPSPPRVSDSARRDGEGVLVDVAADVDDTAAEIVSDVDELAGVGWPGAEFEMMLLLRPLLLGTGRGTAGCPLEERAGAEADATGGVA